MYLSKYQTNKNYLIGETFTKQYFNLSTEGNDKKNQENF